MIYRVCFWILICSLNNSIAMLEHLYNPNRLGFNYYQQQDFKQAFDTFKDSTWRGISAYKMGNYQEAINEFAKVKGSMIAKYNLANALALNGDLEKAVAEYKDLLVLDPEHTDAKYNLKVVEELLKQQPPCKNKSKQNNDRTDNQEHDSKDNNRDSQAKDDAKDNETGSEDSQEKDDAKDSETDSEGSQEKDDAKDNETGSEDSQAKDDAKDSETDSEDSQAKDDAKDSETDSEDSQAKDDAQEEQSSASNAKDNSYSQTKEYDEKQQADEQWLRSIPDDPGGLLQQKFLRDYLQRGKTR